MKYEKSNRYDKRDTDIHTDQSVHHSSSKEMTKEMIDDIFLSAPNLIRVYIE